MKIPKRFRLLGHTISVEMDKSLKFNEEAKGMALWRTHSIKIQCPVSWPVPQSDIEHTFCHEMTHMILCAMSKDKLNEDEEFVDMFSGLLHQALTSMEYK